MAPITLRGVTKTFGNKTVLNAIDLEIKDGEFLVLLGASGCGKSTLLRMLAGLESVSSGQVIIGDRQVENLPPSERDIAFVFQSYALYPHLTVRENIAFPLAMEKFRWWYHIPLLGTLAKRRIKNDPKIAERVEQVAKLLALGPMLDRRPKTLSGGQRQRVALGRAMVRKPDAFLMDEPLSNLDAKLRATMRAEIAGLHRELGSTFIYVTHDQIEAMTMGTRIALMRDGVVQQIGTPREMFTDPVNTFVARFIGMPSMNLIHAGFKDGTVGFGDYRLPLPHISSTSSVDVLLGVRPQDIAVSAGDGAGARATVVGIENVGAETVVLVRADGARAVSEDDARTADMISCVVPGYVDFQPGQQVRLSLNADNCLLFSKETEQRIR